MNKCAHASALENKVCVICMHACVYVCMYVCMHACQMCANYTASSRGPGGAIVHVYVRACVRVWGGGVRACVSRFQSFIDSAQMDTSIQGHKN